MAFYHSFKKFLGLEEASSLSATPPISTNEVEHINQEMYKKSAELADRNKTLALLEKINELILGSITDLYELAQEATKLLVTDADFQIASIFLRDKKDNKLILLARSQNDTVKNSSETKGKKEISLADKNSFIVQVINGRTPQFADALSNDALEQSVFIAPLFVRNELMGVLDIALKDKKSDISEFRHDLLNRLVGPIGIGIDNALLYNEVENANERLKALDKLKNEFVSVASHELRTPMTAIKSYLWMALNGKGGKLNDKQAFYVQRGYNSVDRLIRLVNDMLNISRIESGRITIELQSQDILKLTQEVVDEVLPRATELGIALKVEKPESLPLVLADSDKIKEVLINLIGNSLKFTPKGGSITIKFAQKDGFVETSIIDTGSGIAPGDMGKLFQKFGLLPGSYITNQTSTHMGTGLGLFICRSIIDLHHGDIKVSSEGVGKGSTFSFTLKEFEASDMQELKTEAAADGKAKVDLIHTKV